MALRVQVSCAWWNMTQGNVFNQLELTCLCAFAREARGAVGVRMDIVNHEVGVPKADLALHQAVGLAALSCRERMVNGEQFPMVCLVLGDKVC